MSEKINALDDQLWLSKADAGREEGFASADDVSAFLADLGKPDAEIGNNKASSEIGAMA
jgi:hypothetical protein